MKSKQRRTTPSPVPPRKQLKTWSYQDCPPQAREGLLVMHPHVVRVDRGKKNQEDVPQKRAVRQGAWPARNCLPPARSNSNNSKTHNNISNLQQSKKLNMSRILMHIQQTNNNNNNNNNHPQNHSAPPQQVLVRVRALALIDYHTQRDQIKRAKSENEQISQIADFEQQKNEQMGNCSNRAMKSLTHNELELSASREALCSLKTQVPTQHGEYEQRPALNLSDSSNRGNNTVVKFQLQQVNCSNSDCDQNELEKLQEEQALQTRLEQLLQQKSEIVQRLEQTQKLLENESARRIQLEHQNEELHKNLAGSELVEQKDFLVKQNEIILSYLKEKEEQLIQMQQRVLDLQEQMCCGEQLRKLLHEELLQMRGNLRIFCRIRPLQPSSPDSEMSDAKSIILFPEKTLQTEQNQKQKISIVQLRGADTRYYFDQVFDESVSQQRVFEELLPLVQSCVDGERVCIIAYGQTGSGKTYTLQGAAEQDQRGLFPRIAQFLLAERKRLADNTTQHISIQVGVYEIYNETITDLLSETRLTIVNGAQSVEIKNLMHREICSEDDLADVVHQASATRQTDKTNANDCSSRSHCIFHLRIFDNDRMSEGGQLTVVDLAGSERAKHLDNNTRNEIEKEKLNKLKQEAGFINKSLTSLGRIIREISEKKALQKVSFRETKLTHCLKNYLSKNGSKTVLFITVCASEENEGLTRESLKFCQRTHLP